MIMSLTLVSDRIRLPLIRHILIRFFGGQILNFQNRRYLTVCRLQSKKIVRFKWQQDYIYVGQKLNTGRASVVFVVLNSRL
jgi:hypothetical protein